MFKQITIVSLQFINETLVSLKRLVLGLNKDKSRVVVDSLNFGEDDDGVEDESGGSLTVNSWSFLVSEDIRLNES
ncbi:hypothetical protein Tco_1340378, partial [Tanacetum coccineum]